MLSALPPKPTDQRLWDWVADATRPAKAPRIRYTHLLEQVLEAFRANKG